MSEILYQHFVAQRFLNTRWRQAYNLYCKFSGQLFFSSLKQDEIHYEEDKANGMPFWESLTVVRVYIFEILPDACYLSNSIFHLYPSSLLNLQI